MSSFAEPLVCTVLVFLQTTVLEIRTTPAHALAFVAGRTPFDPADVAVRDIDGRPLEGAHLLALAKRSRTLSTACRLDGGTYDVVAERSRRPRDRQRRR